MMSVSDDTDPRTAFLGGLDISACRVEFSSAPIVLLCGGQVKYDAPQSESAISLRHAVAISDTRFELFRPEEIKDWHADSLFSNLMSFEKELASICSLVVIILESEGALAELGAFSQLSELSEKIIAIRSSLYANHPSFINLGILRFITAQNETAVKSYPWDIKNPATISREITQDVIHDIQEELAKQPQSQSLKLNQNSHVIVVICEFVRLFTALKEHEIFEYLQLLGVATTRDLLRGQLFLLTEFRIIRKQEYSDAVFYMRSDEPYHKLRIALKDKKAHVDQLRVEAQCSEYYLAHVSKHRNRNRAIAASKKRVAK